MALSRAVLLQKAAVQGRGVVSTLTTPKGSARPSPDLPAPQNTVGSRPCGKRACGRWCPAAERGRAAAPALRQAGEAAPRPLHGWRSVKPCPSSPACVWQGREVEMGVEWQAWGRGREERRGPGCLRLVKLRKGSCQQDFRGM